MELTDTPDPTGLTAPAPEVADPLSTVAWPLRTERLTLRRAVAADDEAMWSYWRLEDVPRWHRRQPADLAEFRAAMPLRRHRTIAVELGGEVVGDLGVDLQDAWAQREVADRAHAVEAVIGYTLNPAHGGRGLATEAVRELLRMCFEDLRVRRVQANPFLANGPSVRLLERVGMRREAHLVRAALHRDLGWLDMLQYAVLAEEWDGGDA